MLIDEETSEKNIKTRIVLVKATLNKREVLFSENLKLDPKERVVETLVWSGSKTWTLKQADNRRLESYEVWFWRRMERVS